jgi:fatty-acid desaturase
MLCKYKNIFGKPNQGVHSIRLFDIALVDLLGTFLIALLITYFFKINVFLVFLILMIIAILIHRLFCVNTKINVFIFGKV